MNESSWLTSRASWETIPHTKHANRAKLYLSATLSTVCSVGGSLSHTRKSQINAAWLGGKDGARNKDLLSGWLWGPCAQICPGGTSPSGYTVQAQPLMRGRRVTAADSQEMGSSSWMASAQALGSLSQACKGQVALWTIQQRSACPPHTAFSACDTFISKIFQIQLIQQHPQSSLNLVSKSVPNYYPGHSQSGQFTILQSPVKPAMSFH